METVTQLFKALSEPVRLRIITLLLNGERCVCDLMAVLDMPQSTVSRHLAYLKNAGLITGKRQGVWMYYQLAKADSDLHAGLIALLKSQLPEILQTKADMVALVQYETGKSEKKC
jgi:ArsR family transcriptional regulator